MQRPLGVTLIAILEFVFGAVVAISGVWLVVGSTAAPQRVATLPPGIGGPWLGSFFLVFGVLLLLAGYGLWTLRSWGWGLAVGIEVANLLGGAAGVVQGMLGAVFTMLLHGIVLWYLFRPHVRAAFSHRVAADQERLAA